MPHASPFAPTAFDRWALRRVVMSAAVAGLITPASLLRAELAAPPQTLQPLVTADSLSMTDQANKVDFRPADQFAYDDNLYRLPSGTENLGALIGPKATFADRIDTASFEVVGQAIFGGQSIGFDATADHNWYLRNGDLDNTSGKGVGVWDWNLGTEALAELGAKFDRSLASFANNKYFHKDMVDSEEYFGNGVLAIGARWQATAGIRYAEITHSAAPLQLIDNFHSDTENIGIKYVSLSENSAGWEYRHTDGRFPLGIYYLGNLPFDRDYKEDNSNFFVTYSPTSKTLINASYGYLKHDYITETISSFSGAVWRASIQWQPTAKTAFQVSTARALTANIEAESDYYVSTGGGVQVDWRASLKVDVSLKVSYQTQNYINSEAALPGTQPRRDKMNDQQVIIDLTPRHAIDVKISYGFEQHESNLADFEYNDRIASAKLTFTF